MNASVPASVAYELARLIFGKYSLRGATEASAGGVVSVFSSGERATGVAMDACASEVVLVSVVTIVSVSPNARSWPAVWIDAGEPNLLSGSSLSSSSFLEVGSTELCWSSRSSVTAVCAPVLVLPAANKLRSPMGVPGPRLKLPPAPPPMRADHRDASLSHERRERRARMLALTSRSASSSITTLTPSI
jgi:hypothetical protein